LKNNDLGAGDGLVPDDLLGPVLGLMETDGTAALSGLDRLLAQYAGDPRLHFMRGSLLAGLERYDEARTAMQKAVDLAPDYALARFQLGFLALTSGDAAGAQAIWLPLANLPEDNPLRLFVRGLNAMLAGDFQDAISLLAAGIERNREIAPLNGNMAVLITEMREKLGSADAGDNIESDAHFLLRQYSFKDTRH